MILRLAALALLLAGPALAQEPPDRALRGVSQLRGVVGLQAVGPARGRCGIAPGMEGELYALMRAQPEGAGLRIPATSRGATVGEGHLVVASTGTPPGTPGLFVNFSVVTLGRGAEAVCASALTLHLRARVTGQVTATGAAFEQDLILWETDATDIAAGPALPAAMRAQLLAAIELFITDWRAQQPRQSALPATKFVR